MSARRVIALLVAAAVAIAAGLWLASRSRSGPPSSVGAPVLEGARVAVNDVTEMRLSRGDGTRTTLKRDGSGWIVAERGYVADSGKVRKLALDVTDLRIVEEKTRDPANYAQLGVEDVAQGKSGSSSASGGSGSSGGVLVELVAPAQTRSLIIGKSSGTKASFVRRAGEPLSLLASPQLSVDADPRRWLDSALVDIDAARVHRVEVTPVSGPAYSAIRAEPGTADLAIEKLPKGRELSSPSAANALASGLDGFTIDDVSTTPTSNAPASDAPAGTPRAVFTTFDGLVVELAGHKDGTRTLVEAASRFDGATAERFAAKAKEAKLKNADEARKEAEGLAARAKGRRFEVQAWKFDGLFRPLEELLKGKEEN
jgi:hypothetical protein